MNGQYSDSTLDTRQRKMTNKIKNTTQKTKKMSTTDFTKKPWVKSCALMGYQFLFL